MKLFFILLAIGALCIGAIYVYNEIISKDKAIVPTIKQYSAPIGPQKDPPYQLPSKLNEVP